MTHQNTQETVEDRLKKAISNVLRQIANDKVEYLLIAGAASQLPLLRDVLEKKLPNAKFIHDAAQAKHRVATGLAKYVDKSRDQPALYRDFHKPNDIVRADLGWRREKFNVVIPMGAHWEMGALMNGRQKTEFEFTIHGDQLQQGNYRRGDRKKGSGVLLPLSASAKGIRVVGYFDLEDVDGVATPLTVRLPRDKTYNAKLRVRGRDVVQLQISDTEVEYGWFSVHWQIGLDELSL